MAAVQEGQEGRLLPSTTLLTTSTLSLHTEHTWEQEINGSQKVHEEQEEEQEGEEDSEELGTLCPALHW